MAELKEQGLVRHIGVSNFDVDQLRRIQAIAPAETLQPPYSLIARGVEDAVTRERIATLAEDDWRNDDPRFAEPQPRHLALVERLQTVAAGHDTTPVAVAAAWTLHHPAVDGTIIGFRRVDHVDAILDAGRLELTDTDLADIENPHRPATTR